MPQDAVAELLARLGDPPPDISDQVARANSVPLCELHDAELAVEIHELREAVKELLTVAVVLPELAAAVNDLVTFANRTDAALAGVRRMLGEGGPLTAIRLVATFKSDAVRASG